MTVPLLNPQRIWECPSCGYTHVARAVGVQSKLHQCPRQKGLVVPLVDVTDRPAVKSRHVPVVREDYVGAEVGVRFDADGRAVSAVRTERSDGSNDCVVFAPTAVHRKE